MHWNAQGITTRSAIDELTIFVNENKIDIVLLNETFLKTQHKFKIPGYTIYRNDRASHGGEVLIAIKSSIKHFAEKRVPTVGIENIAITVTFNNKNIQFISAYNPRYSQDFKLDLDKLTSISMEYFLFGDLNSHHQSWNCFTSNAAGNILFNHQLNSNYFIHFPSTPTRYTQTRNDHQPSTVDLILSNCSFILQDVVTHDGFVNSDHLPITCKVYGNVQYENNKNHRNYTTADWPSIKRWIDNEVSSVLPSIICDSHVSIDCSVKKMTDILERAILKVPLTEKQMFLIRISDQTKKLIATRRTYKRRLNRCIDINRRLTLISSIKLLNKLIATNLDIDRNNNWNHFLGKLSVGHKKFWKITSAIRGKNRRLPNLLNENEELLTDDRKAEKLADEFAKSHEITRNFLHSNNRQVERLSNATGNQHIFNNDRETLTDEDEILYFIKLSKTAKSPGPDEIPNIVLKHLPKSMLKLMNKIFNACIQQCYFPKDFRHAIVVPVPKPGKDARCPSNYRPISLLSNVSKIFEKIVKKRIEDHLERRQILPNKQYGFRQEHSCIHQVKRVINIIKNNKERRKSTGILFLDLQKAFDTIWHDGLVSKMHKFQFPQYLIHIIKNFISERSFRVRCGNRLSSSRFLPAGLPQGSVLSPVLFNVYIADFKLVKNINFAQYADDSAVILEGKSSNKIIKNMRLALLSAKKYFHKWKIKINETKTQAIIFPFNKSPKRIPTVPLMFNGHRIELSHTIKYLGLSLDKKLTFKQHLLNAAEKALKCSRSLCCILNRKSHLNTKNKLILYKTCIRPILTYGSPIWISCAKTHKSKIQRVQNKILKMIHNLDRMYPTSALHQNFKHQTIEEFIQKTTDTFIRRCQQSTYEHLRTLY